MQSGDVTPRAVWQWPRGGIAEHRLPAEIRLSEGRPSRCRGRMRGGRERPAAVVAAVHPIPVEPRSANDAAQAWSPPGQQDSQAHAGNRRPRALWPRSDWQADCNGLHDGSTGIAPSGRSAGTVPSNDKRLGGRCSCICCRLMQPPSCRRSDAHDLPDTPRHLEALRRLSWRIQHIDSSRSSAASSCPSSGRGCGKTTTLHMIAGFVTPTAGDPAAARDITPRAPRKARHGHRVPELRSFSAHDGVGQRRVRAARCANVPRERAARVAERSISCALTGRRARIPKRALAAGSAAGRPGPGAGDRARACCCSTSRSSNLDSEAARGHAASSCAQIQRPARHHHDLRHPRPGRGAGADRPHRGDAAAAGSSSSARPRRSTSGRKHLSR